MYACMQAYLCLHFTLSFTKVITKAVTASSVSQTLWMCSTGIVISSGTLQLYYTVPGLH